MLRSRAWIFALFIGALGLLPHILFSLNTGGLNYVTGAWDEDSYSYYLLTHQDTVYRLLSNIVSRAVHATLGLDLAIIAMDTVLPAISAALAVMIAHALGFTERKHWFLAACLILFPMELLTFSHPYFWQEAVVNVSPFAGAPYMEPLRQIVPNIYQNFFSIYKAPEPQFTLIFQLGALYLLLRYAQTQAPRYALRLLLFVPILPFIYISTSVTLLLLAGGYGFLSLLSAYHRRYWAWLAVTAFASLYVAWAQLHFAKGSAGPELIFFSHLPAISASTLYGMFGLWIVWRQWRWRWSAPVRLAIVALLVPIAVLNQQILTGVMVQTRTWEYYSNYPYIALGLLLLWPQLRVLLPSRIQRSARYLCPLLIVLISVAQFMTLKGYQKGDLVALGYADGVKAAGDFKGYVLLDNPDHDSQVWLRVGNPDLKILAGYQDIIANPIRELWDSDYEVTYDRMKDRAFTLFDRKGIEPQELQQLITDGIGTGGWYVRYFFAFLDCWYPLTDFRNANPDLMLERIPTIIADYQAFLNDPKRRNQFGELLYVTETPIHELRDVPWENQKVAMVVEGKWRSKTVYVYRQIPTPLEK